ncbi:MAG: DUF2703 domain-containing protein [Candidatus Diapherotrites archaeon]|nr:DUF2703 domain-containing protein [Candidatus Diapherotrites archaeon]
MIKTTDKKSKIKIQVLYLLDCPWCVKTKKLVKESLKELGLKAEVEEIIIDSENKAKKFNFVGSPTVRINGEDIQETIAKNRCIPCEKIANKTGGASEYVTKECKCGCRVYFYKGKIYNYPPKQMIKKAICKLILKYHTENSIEILQNV